MTIDNTVLGQAIKRLRKVRGMTQVGLATAAGLSGSGNTVAMIERGERGVSLQTLNCLAEALGVDAACLTVLGSKDNGRDNETTELLKSVQVRILEELLKGERTPSGHSSRRTKRRSTTASSAAEVLEGREMLSAPLAPVEPSPAVDIADCCDILPTVPMFNATSVDESRELLHSPDVLAAPFAEHSLSASPDASTADSEVDRVMMVWPAIEWWSLEEVIGSTGGFGRVLINESNAVWLQAT